MPQPELSIIIPTYQEAHGIGQLIRYLRMHTQSYPAEILVVDGQSTDGTAEKARQAGADAVWQSQPGRAIQMNAGARHAKANILYFLHADTYPPPSFVYDIRQAIAKGYHAGCFRMRFDSPHWLLKINQFFTRFPFLFCRGGDQSLFITRSLFEQLHGFNEHMQIMEDFDIISRIRQITRFYIIPREITVSARKYQYHGWLEVQLANWKVMRMWRKGASQAEMIAAYKRLLHHRTSTAPPAAQD